ncbi:MAG TPA: tRNA (adenosine(37)-N6)-dimethylallyltransferase MiaA [Candidatus Cloacimonas sp.]|nr:tRNA (adenosine(37)-N6)-dimethylallyltransferase MiaA [Candidatus Cloacimonas sp.]
MINVITIEGPTASGKSALALALAENLGSQIISADSRQVYRYLNIGTAKPNLEEQRRVRHHLIDIIDPSQSYNAGAFTKDARIIIENLNQKGIVPIVCGGTGLYIRALLQGLFELPEQDPALREYLQNRLKTEGLNSLFAELQQLDPDFAMKISPNDPQRILRGLEVALGTGIPLSEHWRRQNRATRLTAFRILIDPLRAWLYKRIDQRMRLMIENGLLDEITELLKMGYDFHSPGLNSLGYKEFIPAFENRASLQDCTDLAAQHHRNYSKRQVTWYRKCSFDLTLDSSAITISEMIRRFEVEYSEAKKCKLWPK